MAVEAPWSVAATPPLHFLRGYNLCCSWAPNLRRGKFPGRICKRIRRIAWLMWLGRFGDWHRWIRIRCQDGQSIRFVPQVSELPVRLLQHLEHSGVLFAIGMKNVVYCIAKITKSLVFVCLHSFSFIFGIFSFVFANNIFFCSNLFFFR